MGTSTGYTPSSGPQWATAKTAVTGSINPERPNASVQKALKQHLRAKGRSDGPGGGAGGFDGGPTGGTGGGSTGGGSAGGGYTGFSQARSAASSIGSFISSVQSIGLEEALKKKGLSDLVGKPLHDVVQGIVSTVIERTGYIEETDALTAAGRIFDDLEQGCETLDEFEARLEGLADTAEFSRIMSEFFRYVLVEDFMRHYWRHLQEKCPNGRIEKLRAEIESLLFEKLKYDLNYVDLGSVDWESAEASILIERIEKETFELCCEVGI